MCRTKRCSEREPADLLRDKPNVIGGPVHRLGLAIEACLLGFVRDWRALGRRHSLDGLRLCNPEGRTSVQP